MRTEEHQEFDGNKEGLNPAPNVLYTPALSLSYRSTRLELDLLVSPYMQMNLNTFYLKPGENDVATNWNYCSGLGLRGKAIINYFFSLKFGIYFSADFCYMWNIDPELDDAGFSNIDRFQFLLPKLGMVFRI